MYERNDGGVSEHTELASLQVINPKAQQVGEVNDAIVRHRELPKPIKCNVSASGDSRPEHRLLSLRPTCLRLYLLCRKYFSRSKHFSPETRAQGDAAAPGFWSSLRTPPRPVR